MRMATRKLLFLIAYLISGPVTGTLYNAPGHDFGCIFVSRLKKYFSSVTNQRLHFVIINRGTEDDLFVDDRYAGG